MAAIAMVTASIGGHLVSSSSPIFNKSSSMSLRYSNLASVTSQLSGIKVSCDPACFQLPPSSTISAPFRPSLQPVVARRVCPFTGKKSNNGNRVSHSNHKTKRLQFVNLQYKKIWWEAGNRYVKLRLSTKAIKTIEKNGLDVVAKKAGIDLRKL